MDIDDLTEENSELQAQIFTAASEIESLQSELDQALAKLAAMESQAAAPSHSQQSEQESTNVWEAALIEAAQSVVRANRNNTGREPSCSLLAMRIDELREILDDANVYYPGDTDRCPSHESEQPRDPAGALKSLERHAERVIENAPRDKNGRRID